MNPQSVYFLSVPVSMLNRFCLSFLTLFLRSLVSPQSSKGFREGMVHTAEANRVQAHMNCASG